MLLTERLPEAVRTRLGPDRLTTPRQDLVAVALGLWLVLGVFVDGWAHLNQPALETFFTPWHGLLYSGAAASFAFVALLVRRYGGVPPGYGPAVVGGPLFLLAGAGDFGWHQVFGLEAGLDALLSPTHLLLLASGLMVLSTAWWVDVRRAARAGVPGVLSLVLATALAGFFLLYTSAFTTAFAAEPLSTIPEGAPGHEQAQLPATAGLAGYLVTTLLLLVPLLLLLRRRGVPVGSATALLGVVGTLSAAVVELRQPLVPVAAVLAGLLLDVLLVRSRRWPQRRRVLTVAAALPLTLWSLQLAGLAVTDAVRWPVELWSGVVLLSTGVAVLFAGLSLGPTVRTEPGTG